MGNYFFLADIFENHLRGLKGVEKSRYSDILRRLGDLVSLVPMFLRCGGRTPRGPQSLFENSKAIERPIRLSGLEETQKPSRRVPGRLGYITRFLLRSRKDENKCSVGMGMQRVDSLKRVRSISQTQGSSRPVATGMFPTTGNIGIWTSTTAARPFAGARCSPPTTRFPFARQDRLGIAQWHCGLHDGA